MTAAELIKELSSVPPDTEVVIDLYDIRTGKEIGDVFYTPRFSEPIQWMRKYDHSKPPDCVILSCSKRGIEDK